MGPFVAAFAEVARIAFEVRAVVMAEVVFFMFQILLFCENFFFMK